ncbi:MAG: hypothetical protein ACI9MC_002060 [Kiritimatiellia bacterium]|jgi:hypothetical protein
MLLTSTALLWTMSAYGAGTATDSDVSTTDAVSTDVDSNERRMYTCRRLIGLTGGLMTTDQSWVFVDDGPIRLLGSPIVGLGCEVGRGRTRWFVGLDSAPFYRTRRFNQTEVGRHWITVSTGAMVGDGVWRGGPFVTGGWGWLGVGARALYLPWKGDAGRRGFEGRLTGVYNGGFGAQMTVLYTLTARDMGAKR